MTRADTLRAEAQRGAEETGELEFFGYARMSTIKGDESAGIGRQKHDGDDLAASLGGRIVRWFVDDGVPASNPDIVRPEFEEMLEELAAGKAAGLLFYHADRLARLETDAARINVTFMKNSKLIGRSATGGTDLSTPEGRAMFTMQATMGTLEVSNIKRRVARTNLAEAESGSIPVSPRPFGWEDDRKTIRKEEADLIKQAHKDILEGKTIGEIRREWIELGLESKRQTKRQGTHNLNHSTVEYRLTTPRLCGYRVYVPQEERRELKKKLWLPDLVVYKDGAPVIGEWDAIVTPEQWKAVVAVIQKRKETRAAGLTQPHSTSATYLLAGIARCGICLHPMRATMYTKGTRSYELYKFRYQCLGSEGGCGGVSRIGPLVDDHVEELFLKAQEESLGDVETAEVDDTVHDARLAEIESELEDVRSRRREKRISTKDALDLIEELEQERNQLVAEARSLTAEKVRRSTVTPNLLREWGSKTISMKRDGLRRDIRAVLIHPAGRGRRKFDPELIDIDWI